MKSSKLIAALAVVAACFIGVPSVYAAQGKSASHRQDGAHGHKGHKGGKSADHRQDGDHRNDHAGDNGH